MPLRVFLRRSVRYLLIKRGFRILEAVVVLAALTFVLTGSRIAEIDRLGNRADIVASVIVTAISIALLTAVNRRMMVAIDRRFFREAYDAQIILTQLGEAVRRSKKIEELVQLVTVRILAALHPENVTILLVNETSGDLVPPSSGRNTTDETDSSILVFPHDGMIVRWLKELPVSKTLRVDELVNDYEGTQARERQTIRTLHPALLIPITSNNHLYGVISLGKRLGDLAYSSDDEQLLLTVASQMSTVIENARLIRQMADDELIKRELEMATEVQRELFPPGPLDCATLDLCGMCVPARWVGGDYYDYFEMGNDRLAIAIADVSGKGISAALSMSTVQALLHSQLSLEGRSLIEVVSAMNRLLRRSTGEARYVTFFIAQFDERTRELLYVNAGHNPPMLIRRKQAWNDTPLRTPQSRQSSGVVVNSRQPPGVVERGITTLTIGGPILGTFLDEPYELESVQLEPGNVLVAYTDGVTEALNPQGAEFGEERLRSIVEQSMHLTAEEITAQVLANVRAWRSSAPQHDDITLIVGKVK